MATDSSDRFVFNETDSVNHFGVVMMAGGLLTALIAPTGIVKGSPNEMFAMAGGMFLFGAAVFLIRKRVEVDVGRGTVNSYTGVWPILVKSERTLALAESLLLDLNWSSRQTQYYVDIVYSDGRKIRLLDTQSIASMRKAAQLAARMSLRIDRTDEFIRRASDPFRQLFAVPPRTP
jgi:hypothetical protein